MIARPGIGVQRVVTEVLVQRAMEIARPGAGENADLGAGSPAVLGRVAGRQNLHFRCRIHVRRAQAGAVRSSARSGSAVVSDQVFRIPRSVEIGRALAEIEAQSRQIAAAGAGDQAPPDPPDCGRSAPARRSAPGSPPSVPTRIRSAAVERVPITSTVSLADPTVKIGIQAQVGTGIQFVVRAFKSLEARRRYAEAVQAGRDVRDGIEA